MKPYRRLSFLLFSIVMALSLGCSEEGSTGAAGPEYTPFRETRGGRAELPGLPGDPQDGTKPEGGTEGGGSETEGGTTPEESTAFLQFFQDFGDDGNRAQERHLYRGDPHLPERPNPHRFLRRYRGADRGRTALF